MKPTEKQDLLDQIALLKAKVEEIDRPKKTVRDLCSGANFRTSEGQYVHSYKTLTPRLDTYNNCASTFHKINILLDETDCVIAINSYGRICLVNATLDAEVIE